MNRVVRKEREQQKYWSLESSEEAWARVRTRQWKEWTVNYLLEHTLAHPCVCISVPGSICVWERLSRGSKPMYGHSDMLPWWPDPNEDMMTTLLFSPWNLCIHPPICLFVFASVACMTVNKVWLHIIYLPSKHCPHSTLWKQKFVFSAIQNSVIALQFFLQWGTGFLIKQHF